MAREFKAGRYQVIEEIGRGGMGVVYAARDDRLGRKVALKMIPKELVRNQELRRRLGQEARAASALSHPGIATVYDFVEEGEESFIVYEFVEGLTLRQRLKSRPFSTEEILEIGVPLAETLAMAHERGIIHRDLKPENIMLSKKEDQPARVKVLDFGLAKLYGPITSASGTGRTASQATPVATAPGLLVGTVNYMSPEQLEGKPADHRSDIYALGLVLYEMATGGNPFVGRSPTSTIANILKEEPPPVTERNPVAPFELDRILRKCLRKRREERYQSAREFLVDLSNLRRDSEKVGPRPKAETPVPLEIPRGLARGLFLLIQVAYLVMYGLAFHWFRKKPDLMPMVTGTAFERWTFICLVVAAFAGTPVRLYLLSAVGFDYSDSGRLFRQMFLIVLFFDVAWSVSPLLLYPQLGLAVFLLIPALAYLPFSQRTLIFSAYGASGGRTSGVKTPSSA